MSARQSGVEVRSIDYVPLSERHGKLWHLGPLWFMGNAQIATLAVGVVGVEAGGNLFWSLVAILAGVLTGTFFMVFHSAQGPQLGLPQMIQSRDPRGLHDRRDRDAPPARRGARPGEIRRRPLPHPVRRGPIAKALDGADPSLFVGLPVPAGPYLGLARSIDVAAERRIAER